MNASAFNPDRLEQLTVAHMTGELTDDEKSELAILLDQSQEARKEFVKVAHFESALTRLHHDARDLEIPPAVDAPAWLPRFRQVTRIVPWLVTAASLLLVLHLASNRSSTENLPEQPATHFTALLVDQVGARFAPQRKEGEVAFSPGEYELADGTVQLRFANGVDLVVQSPAKFEIHDVMRSQLFYGNVRAVVPPSAEGFTIDAADVQFEDVGTEFGLRVDRGSSVGSLHVFDGQVNVRSAESNAVLKQVFEGQSIECRDGISSQIDTLNPDSFPNPSRIGFKRWRANQETLINDPDLVAYFPFTQDANDASLLKNLKTHDDHPVADSVITGARWMSGRWQGKESLLFDRDSDFAEFELPGEFNELTIAAWVYINRRDHPVISVVDSNGWEPGDVHLQFNRYGAAYVDICETRQRGSQSELNEKWTNQVASTGCWVHLATSISLTQRNAIVYVNGKVVHETSLRRDGLIRPGVCRIGNWLPTGTLWKTRAFNGRIDEVAIWKRALSDQEIAAEITRGRPSLLWPDETK
ncbi:FecR family protein [Neorhodopirellula lusitana]|uniref:FecR family protein n=1 Tax=Neorhodopirellula lusitana TaxID=445327 RepID=A0ABY1QJL8_9BACT|nr:LamG-like jellyroll fold domain-containing protein [Neorhodopirellula lusitana]SMP73369.1 FecR family protein [Neorhodopirellula lusitana]